MKALKEKANGIIFGAFELIVGLLLLINPAGFTSAIIIMAGIALMVLGLYDISERVRWKQPKVKCWLRGW